MLRGGVWGIYIDLAYLGSKRIRLAEINCSGCCECGVYRRVTTTVRQPVLPLASVARRVTVFDPTSSGIVALHWVVPVAVPADPVFVVHVTLATAPLSEAVPMKFKLSSEVATEVEPGEVILSVGGVLSPGIGVVTA